jgi:hypothetical protein
MKKLIKDKTNVQPVEYVPYQKHMANDIAISPENQFR